MGDVGIAYASYLYLAGKLVVDFLFVIIELFRYILRLRRYKRKYVKVGVLREWSISANILGGKDNSQQPRWSGKTRDISVLYGVEILPDD